MLLFRFSTRLVKTALVKRFEEASAAIFSTKKTDSLGVSKATWPHGQVLFDVNLLVAYTTLI
jgi:hypothetical protein